MMGDMHCPAHVAIPIEDKPTYEETTVYNRYRLQRKGKKYSYHALWDSITAILFPKRDIPGWLEEVDTYNEKQMAPMVRTICKESGLKLKQIYELFPLGPARGACRVAGLPKPDGCV